MSTGGEETSKGAEQGGLAPKPPAFNPTVTKGPYKFTDGQKNSWGWDFGLKKWMLLTGTSDGAADSAEQPPIEPVELPDDLDIPTPPPPEEWSGRALIHKPTLEDEKGKDSKESKKQQKKKQKEKSNSTVYVTGLPSDITVDYLLREFSKAGVIKKDPETLEPKIKIYKDEEGKPKGDALITYFKRESIPLAIQLLDEWTIKPGYVIRVSEAQFEQKGKRKKKGGGALAAAARKKKQKKIYNQEKELTWEEDERKHVVLKHMFEPNELINKDEIEDLRNDIGTECEKFGEVQKVIIFENNPEGVVVVKFKEHFPAVRCIDQLNGRWFGGRQVVAEFYDGMTNYKVEETEEQQKARLEAYHKYLEEEN